MGKDLCSLIINHQVQNNEWYDMIEFVYLTREAVSRLGVRMSKFILNTEVLYNKQIYSRISLKQNIPTRIKVIENNLFNVFKTKERCNYLRTSIDEYIFTKERGSF